MTARHYLVVGGSHGIGAGIVRRVLNDGHHVTIWSRTMGEFDSIPDGASHFEVDVTGEIPSGAMPESLDGLVYCPGSITLGPIRGVKLEQLASDFELNVSGAVRCIQSALRPLKASGSGSIVMFSTVAVGQGMPMHSVVAMVKGAIEGLTRTLAAELVPEVRVNAIAPALVDTPLAERLLSSDERRAAMDRRHPLGRVGTADDIAAAAAYLLSPESSWVSGQVLGVDGGLSTLRV